MHSTEVTMFLLTPEPVKTRPQPPAPSQRTVPELLLEIAYRMHATRVVAKQPEPDWRPRKSR